MPLNPLVDIIVVEKIDAIERLESVEFKTGPSALFGSGEDAIYTITIKYTNPTPNDQQDIDEIIAIAKNYGEAEGADEIIISVEEN